MAITHIASTGTDTSGTSITGIEPASTAENDHVFCFVQTAETPSTGTWTPPTDFTQIAQKAETTGNKDSHWYLGYKVSDGTAGDGYQFDFSGTSDSLSITVTTLRGVATSPLDVTYVEGSHYVAYDSGSNGVNTAAKAITTVTDNAWVCLFQHCSRTISGSAGAPSGYTVRRDELTGAAANKGLFVCTKEVTTAGTETPGAFTHTDDAVDGADSKVITLALKPLQILSVSTDDVVGSTEDPWVIAGSGFGNQ